MWGAQAPRGCGPQRGMSWGSLGRRLLTRGPQMVCEASDAEARAGGWFLCYFENVFVEKNSFQCQIILLVYCFTADLWGGKWSHLSMCRSGQQTVACGLSPWVPCVSYATNFKGEMTGTLFPLGRGVQLREWEFHVQEISRGSLLANSTMLIKFLNQNTMFPKCSGLDIHVAKPVRLLSWRKRWRAHF